MRHEQSVQNQVENSPTAKKKDTLKDTKPYDTGSNWQFKVLMVIIAFGVLMLVLKTTGVL
jgi:hypothetical protein